MWLYHAYHITTYICEPTLGNQHGGRLAIYQNPHRKRMGLASVWSLYSVIFFFTLPPGYVGLVWFTAMQPQVQVCILCLLFKEHTKAIVFVFISCNHYCGSFEKKRLIPFFSVFRDHLILNNKGKLLEVTDFILCAQPGWWTVVVVVPKAAEWL